MVSDRFKLLPIISLGAVVALALCFGIAVSDDSDAAGSPVSIISVPETSVTSGASYTYTLVANCSTPTAADWVLPDWLSVSSSGWILSGTAPSTVSAVTYPVVVTVSSDTYQDVQTWTIIVYPDSSTLKIVSDPDSSVSSGAAYFHIPLSNIRGTTWTFSYLPSWLSYNDGYLYGVAPYCETDTDYTFTIHASYRSASVDQIVTVRVAAFESSSKEPIVVDDTVLQQSQIDSKTFKFRFYDYSDLGIRTVVWDFGDGTGSISFEPYHRYEQPGTYLVTCSFYSNDGGSGTQEAYITVVDNPSMWESLIDFLGYYQFWIVIGLMSLVLIYLFTRSKFGGRRR